MAPAFPSPDAEFKLVTDLDMNRDRIRFMEGITTTARQLRICFRSATSGKLNDLLGNGVAILHFSGHGTSKNAGHILFEEDRALAGRGAWVPGKWFAEMLAQHNRRLPKLVFLSACHSGTILLFLL